MRVQWKDVRTMVGRAKMSAILIYNHSVLGVLRRPAVVANEGRQLDDPNDPSMHHKASRIRGLGMVLV